MLSVRNIHKKFATVTAVDDLSFEVQQGEIVALLGPNGAGKTTTVRMLIGMQKPDQGEITFTNHQGQSVKSLSAQALGYLPEERGLYLDRKVIQVLRYFGQLHGMGAADAVKKAEQWLDYFELADRSNEQIQTLSKGNQQKIQIVSAILHSPEFAILDEPFSGFDPINQEKVIELILDLKKQGTTVLLSAHQMDLVERLADRIILLDHGRIVFQGTLEQIRGQAAYSRQMLIEFSEAISPQAIEVFDSTEFELQLKNDFQLLISFKPETQLNTALEQLMQIGPINTLSSQEVGLHDIYINALSEARA